MVFRGQVLSWRLDLQYESWKAFFPIPGKLRPREGVCGAHGTQPKCTELGLGGLTASLPAWALGLPGTSPFSSLALAPVLTVRASSSSPLQRRMAWAGVQRLTSEVFLVRCDLPVPSGGPRKWKLLKSPVTTPPPARQVSVSPKATGCSESLARVGSRGWNFLT